jgi:large subunit ribosomal protein L6
MSRVGNAPIPIPAGVTVSVNGDTVACKGPKGELSRTLEGGITAAVEGGKLRLSRPDDSPRSKALHGLWARLCEGMVEGVEKGFERRLEVVGVSYQAAVEKGALKLQVGFSHPQILPIPKGVTVECPSPTTILIRGCDKGRVGEFTARVRRTRPPEPYKGKGVRFSGEQVTLKPGKSFVGGGG